MRPKTFLAVVCLGAAMLPAAEPPAWVARSNENTQVLLKIIARFAPEGAGRMGVSGLDEQISDLSSGVNERFRQEMRAGLAELRKREAAETDPLVKQDLSILITAGERNIKASETFERVLLPYNTVTQSVYGGLKALLDDQV